MSSVQPTQRRSYYKLAASFRLLSTSDVVLLDTQLDAFLVQGSRVRTLASGPPHL